MTINGFRSAVYDGDRLRLRISGDVVTVSNAKAFGPFSFGFLYSLTGRNVTLDTFVAEPGTESLSPKRFSALLPPQWINLEIADAEVGPVKVIEHRGGRETVVLQAAVCRTSLTSAEVACADGVVNTDGAARPFRRLTYDGDVLHTVP